MDKQVKGEGESDISKRPDGTLISKHPDGTLLIIYPNKYTYNSYCAKYPSQKINENHVSKQNSPIELQLTEDHEELLIYFDNMDEASQGRLLGMAENLLLASLKGRKFIPKENGDKNG